MPIESCQSGGRPGFKYGAGGNCYTYTPGDETDKQRARNAAAKQGQAVEANRSGKSKATKNIHTEELPIPGRGK